MRSRDWEDGGAAGPHRGRSQGGVGCPGAVVSRGDVGLRAATLGTLATRRTTSTSKSGKLSQTFSVLVVAERRKMENVAKKNVRVKCKIGTGGPDFHYVNRSKKF